MSTPRSMTDMNGSPLSSVDSTLPGSSEATATRREPGGRNSSVCASAPEGSSMVAPEVSAMHLRHRRASRDTSAPCAGLSGISGRASRNDRRGPSAYPSTGMSVTEAAIATPPGHPAMHSYRLCGMPWASPFSSAVQHL